MILFRRLYHMLLSSADATALHGVTGLSLPKWQICPQNSAHSTLCSILIAELCAHLIELAYQKSIKECSVQSADE